MSQHRTDSLGNTFQVITDHKYRNLKYGYELPAKVRSDFDWMDDESFQTSDFVQYRGRYYAVEEFMRCEGSDLKALGWEGYHSDSFFSGVVIKLDRECERVMVGLFLS